MPALSRAALIALLTTMTGVAACHDSTAPKAPTITRIDVQAPDTVLGLGDTLRLKAMAFTANGGVIGNAQYAWATSDPLAATVDATGLVRALKAGTVLVRATAIGPTESIGSVTSGSRSLTLRPLVDRIEISVPDTILTGDTVRVAAAAYDGLGEPMPQVAFVFGSGAPGVAAYSGVDSLVAKSMGVDTIIARATGPADAIGRVTSGTKPVHVRLVVTQLASGYIHNCVTARGGVAHCWGEGAWGRLGTGERYEPWVFVTSPVPVASDARFVRVFGDAQQDSRSGHTCGLASDNAAYCWGSDTWGMLADGRYGEGFPPDLPAPQPLPGVGPVKDVGLGAEHTCVLDAGGAALCAGGNYYLQSGVDSLAQPCDSGDPCIPRLARVPGGHTFESIAVGGYHNCALTAAGDAWCWGMNGFGALGTPTSGDAIADPVAVTGMKFTSLAAGEFQTCGLDGSGVAYCWGLDYDGQVGDGQNTVWMRASPTAVSTALIFAHIYAGGAHSCALTYDGTAYCWGSNASGQLGATTSESCGGNGGVIDPCSTSPVAVNTSLRFTSLALGGAHTCGLTAAGSVYCWGANDHGQLGDGTTSFRSVPTRVIDVK